MKKIDPKIIVILAGLLILALGLPLAISGGKSLAFGSPESVRANAELARAQGEKAAMEAEAYQGLAVVLNELPATLQAAGVLILSIVLALGGLSLLVSLAHFIFVRGVILRDEAKYRLETARLEGAIDAPVHSIGLLAGNANAVDELDIDPADAAGGAERARQRYLSSFSTLDGAGAGEKPASTANRDSDSITDAINELRKYGDRHSHWPFTT